jgi:hydrogenase expression/formation protein HypD
MEICGGQTHAILKYGLDRVIPDRITLLHGPGCPVCVTPAHLIDRAIEIALLDNTILCSFGDMLRVPGSYGDLLSARADGADVRIVYSPLDAVDIARQNPEKEVIFFAIGFETTAPANAAAVCQAREMGLSNFSILSSQVLVPPAIEKILDAPDNKVQGFLAAGHVCTVMGCTEYERLARKFKIPFVVTGFEPLDILQGINILIQQLEDGTFRVDNQYARAVKSAGNKYARKIIGDVFEIVDREWRGIGLIRQSGLKLREEFSDYDAEKKFTGGDSKSREAEECISGLILRGVKKPHDCPAFKTICTPENPLGATMVSSEGACAAYYKYKMHHMPPVISTAGD